MDLLPPGTAPTARGGSATFMATSITHRWCVSPIVMYISHYITFQVRFFDSDVHLSLSHITGAVLRFRCVTSIELVRLTHSDMHRTLQLRLSLMDLHLQGTAPM